MTNDFTPPGDPAPAVAPALLTTLVRYMLVAGASALAKQGIVLDSDPAFWTGVATVIATILWGLYSRLKRTRQLRDAIAAPAGQAK